MTEFAEIILKWYQINKRVLPWRETTDPYKILVSEIMLQQTQVDRVIPKYRAFLHKFPTAHDLAIAKKNEVLNLWSGLGYNRRALLLILAAQTIDKSGFPKDPDELQIIKGIGPYTSAAVASFAYNYNVAVLDTNVIRILIRFFYGSKIVKSLPNKIELQTVAQSLLIEGTSREYNNAIMDFGALICTAIPKCPICPLQQSCKIFNEVKENIVEKNIMVTLGTPKGGFGTVQPKFRGSNRFHRGKVLNLLSTGEIKTSMIIKKLEIGKSPSITKVDLKKLLIQLKKEGFITIINNVVKLAE